MDLKPLILALATCGLWLFALSALAQPDGLESQVSKRDYAQTVVALRETLNGARVKIFQEVDHRNNAIEADSDFPPTRVFIFGNPKVGTPLMQCAPLVGLDLPMRMLVRRDSEGQTRLYWTRASTLLARYSSSLSEECRRLAARVDANLAALARKASGADE